MKQGERFWFILEKQKVIIYVLSLSCSIFVSVCLTSINSILDLCYESANEHYGVYCALTSRFLPVLVFEARKLTCLYIANTSGLDHFRTSGLNYHNSLLG